VNTDQIQAIGAPASTVAPDFLFGPFSLTGMEQLSLTGEESLGWAGKPAYPDAVRSIIVSSGTPLTYRVHVTETGSLDDLLASAEFTGVSCYVFALLRSMFETASTAPPKTERRWIHPARDAAPEARRQRNRAAIVLLDAWLAQDADAEDQASLSATIESLNSTRAGSRKLFP
jgi:hypothetical protein